MPGYTKRHYGARQMGGWLTTRRNVDVYLPASRPLTNAEWFMVKRWTHGPMAAAIFITAHRYPTTESI
jgi:hypothetical protein